MSETPVRPQSRRLGGKGARTRRRLLEAAEQVFADLGYHEASMVKITEAAGVAQGTFYLYFSGKQAIFEELIEDLNRRLRHAMSDASAKGTTRIDKERLGFEAFFHFTTSHPALYRVIRQAEFVSPKMLRYHYDKLAQGYIEGLRSACENGEISIGDPVVTAWALMAVGEMIGMRWILWGDSTKVPPEVLAETMSIIARVLGVDQVSLGGPRSGQTNSKSRALKGRSSGAPRDRDDTPTKQGRATPVDKPSRGRSTIASRPFATDV